MNILSLFEASLGVQKKMAAKEHTKNNQYVAMHYMRSKVMCAHTSSPRLFVSAQENELQRKHLTCLQLKNIYDTFAATLVKRDEFLAGVNIAMEAVE